MKQLFYLNQRCFQEKVITLCNCTSPNDYPLHQSNMPSCETGNSCYTGLNNEFSDNNYVKLHCLPRCPLQCNRTEYKTSVNSIQLVGNMYVPRIRSKPSLLEDFVVRELNSETARQSVLRVYIFYDPLSYTQLTEFPNMTRFSLLSSIGGTLSLFLGVSVLSLFEIVEVLIELYLTRKK